MASLVRRGKREFWIQFKNPIGKRSTIRLKDVSETFAVDCQLRIERILASVASKSPLDLQTAQWLGELSPALRKKFAAARLVEPVQHATTIEELFNAHIASLGNVTQRTIEKHGYTLHNLIDFFGKNRPIISITEGDAQDFRSWLYKHGKISATIGGETCLAVTTADKRAKNAKQMFGYAVKKKWLTENPFANIKGFVTTNRSRDFFVDMDLTRRIIDAIPDIEFRALFVLARFGALRIEVEAMGFRWENVDWENELLHVESAKTRRYEGKDRRTIPMFPEIKQYLSELFEIAPEGELLFPNHQKSLAAVTNKLQRVLRRIGEPLWPKVWGNVRATRATEISDAFGLNVLTHWCGHSVTTFQNHYGQVTKDHLARAKSGGCASLFTSPPKELQK